MYQPIGPPHCDWSWNLVGAAAWWITEVQQSFQVVFQDGNQVFDSTLQVIPAQTRMGSYKKTGQSGSSSTSSTWSAPRIYKGKTVPIKWRASRPGRHDITCVIPKTGLEEPTLDNNIAHAIAEVTPKPPPESAGFAAPRPTGSLQQSPGALAAAITPDLSVISAQPQIQSQCQIPQPPLIAKVQIRNRGGALAACRGTVFLKEFGGANLSSAGIQLPAFAPGQIQVISIPAITMQPYSSLAGTHRIQVILSPAVVGGKTAFGKPPQPYQMIAAFPRGYCGQLLQPAQPAARSAQPLQPRGRLGLPQR